MTNKIKSIFSFRTVLILFIVACVFAMLPFTQRFFIALAEQTIGRSLRSVTKWSAVITHTSAFFILLAAALYFLAYIEKGKEIASDIVAVLKGIFKDKKQTALFIAFAAALIFVSYFSIILANYDYTDDIRRSFGGHKAWIGISRIVSEVLAVFIHTNFYINDIWPLTHFISIVLLAFTTYFLAYIATDGKVNLISVLAAMLFSITPYFAVNMSFKFDCPYMVLSVFVTVVPFLFAKDLKTFAFVSFLGLQFACTSYQSAQSVYILMAIFVALQAYTTGKSWTDIIRFAVTAIISYVVSLIFFKFVICMPRTWDEGDFTMTSIAALPHNLVAYTKDVIAGYGNIWIRVFTVLAVILFPFATVSKSQQNKKVTFALSVFALLLMFFLSYGAYLVLEMILLSARAYMGFDIFISLILLQDVTAFANRKNACIISYTVVICLFWGLCVATTSLGTFYNKYNAYTRFRFDALLNDMNDIVHPDEHNALYFTNTIELPESARMVIKNYPLAKFVLTANTTQYLIKGYNMDFEILNEDFLWEIDDEEVVRQLTDLPLIKDTYYHTIYGKDNQYFVEFKNPKPQEK